LAAIVRLWRPPRTEDRGPPGGIHLDSPE